MPRSAVVASLELAAETSGDITPLVYQRLFREHPEMAPLFCLDTDNSVKGSMLAHAIEVVLDFVGERQFAEMFVRDESVTHAGYDVSPDVFGTFFRMLADTIKDVLGERWTAEMASAWDAVIHDLSSCVQRSAGAPAPEATSTFLQ